ncbi:hypothetical protein DNK47_03035 [Mycoplasma wenyonii]|uniref:DUF31 domain-containing protein n=1 Tax=Mycoplasma wenyonii TaxID=65123 RepID=A0A328PP76_9MOLU|nr:hypothetical protein [Mycoplasma wenyonii]RAO94818.1 hypothetical protein DNK47_03035 [Mycoplasma wenyonii]
MPAITWKGGTVLISTIIGSIIGIKKLVTGESIIPPRSDEQYLVSDNLTEQYPILQKGTSSSIDPTSSYIEFPQSTVTDSQVTKLQAEKNYSSWDFANYTEEQKEKNRKEAERIYKILDDYTFKIFMPCGWGTGWILDYQIPKGNSKYPTKWYIATNSHVVWRLSFSENTYKQQLPKWDEWTRHLREKGRQAHRYNEVKNYQGPVRDTCWAVDTVGHIDLNLSHHSTGENNRSDVGGVALGEMKEPKLFFSAFNFLDKKTYGDHFSDFSVMEIEFNSEEIAQRVTRNFATKYENNLQDAINLFGKPIESKYQSKEELWKAKDNYYILSYPKVPGKDKWEQTINWDKNNAIASHLVAHGFEMNERNKNKYKGFVQARKHWEDWRKGFKWQGDVYHKFGHYYQLLGNAVGPGSSGGVFVDGNGVAVAVTGQTSQNPYGTGGMFSWAEPLRSDGVKDEELGINTPKYDLILGAEGQNNSYKQQVEKWILSNGGETWLSRRGKWVAPKKN